VLYSDREAHCEAGEVQSGDPVYASARAPEPVQRGNRIASQ